MSGLEIRDAGPDDWRLWREVRLRALRDSPEAFGATYDREAGFEESDWRGRLSADSPAVLVTADGAPVGTGAGFPDRPGWLRVVAMWVDPAHRGHGIAGEVLDRLVAAARERDLRIHLDVTVGNDGARRLYERARFVATGESRPLRPGSAHVVARMVLTEA